MTKQEKVLHRSQGCMDTKSLKNEWKYLLSTCTADQEKLGFHPSVWSVAHGISESFVVN